MKKARRASRANKIEVGSEEFNLLSRARKYQVANNAVGLCRFCPNPISELRSNYDCDFHLDQAIRRKKERIAKGQCLRCRRKIWKTFRFCEQHIISIRETRRMIYWDNKDEKGEKRRNRSKYSTEGI